METKEHDLVVIGAGPGGYVAAIRAAQLGLNAACVEKEKSPGGTCLRIGCIPSKALLESSELYVQTREHLEAHGIRATAELNLGAMQRRKDQVVATLTKGLEGLFRKHKITRYQGQARIVRPGEVAVKASAHNLRLKARHILVATGSKPAPLEGVELDGERIGTSTEALAYSEVPGHLVVIGAGYIGLELGSVWRRLGARVTVLEYLTRIVPGMDGEIAAEAQKVLSKQGIEFRLGARVLSARPERGQCRVEVEGSAPLLCDRVLLATGRLPQTEGLGLDELKLRLDGRGRIEVNERFETSVPGIYAVGDVIRGPMLAHKAEEEGLACIERIVTGQGHVDYNSIPGVAYTDPEIASVGRTEEQLQEEEITYHKGVFPFLANSRARALNRTEGKVKILADATTDRILGVHIIGAHAGELIAEASVAMAFGASSEDLARASHAHPTLAECLKEAALGVGRRSLHL